MSFSNAQKARVWLGTHNYSGYTKKFASPITVDMLNVDVLTSTSHEFIPGQDDATAALEFLLDSDGAAGNWAQMTAWKTSQPTPLDFFPQGSTTGSAAFMYNADEASFDIASSQTAAVSGSLSVQATGGADLGVCVEDITAVTVDGNGTARDGGAASANGGVAHVHVTAFSGLTSDVVTIEHSVDGVGSWATLVTFATITATTAERVVVAPGTTVRRYLRVVDNVTGTGSISRGVTFARR